MSQLDLTFQAPAIRHPEGVSLSQLRKPDAFIIFHQLNPEVFELLLRLAREMKRDGWAHGSMKLLFERIRWLHAIQTRGDVYKLNNNYTAFYARTLMAAAPELDGFFRLREQGDSWEPDLTVLGLRGEL